VIIFCGFVVLLAVGITLRKETKWKDKSDGNQMEKSTMKWKLEVC